VGSNAVSHSELPAARGICLTNARIVQQRCNPGVMGSLLLPRLALDVSFSP